MLYKLMVPLIIVPLWNESRRFGWFAGDKVGGEDGDKVDAEDGDKVGAEDGVNEIVGAEEIIVVGLLVNDNVGWEEVVKVVGRNDGDCVIDGLYVGAWDCLRLLLEMNVDWIDGEVVVGGLAVGELVDR